MLARILILDDERDILESLKTGLERRGYDVEISCDPKTMLAKFRPQKYDLVFLDMKMPTMGGFEIYREIKQKDPTARVVFLTAFEIHHGSITKTFPDLTEKNFIQKPISISRLVDLIKGILYDSPHGP